MQPLNHFDLRTLNKEAEEAPEWNEVPAALFSSWSKNMQLDYCIRRDLASANNPKCWVGIHDSEWFKNRAYGYKVQLNDELKKMGLTPRD